MEPEQKPFRALCNIVKQVADRGEVLFDRTVAATTPVETEAFRRSLMIIGRGPVGPRRAVVQGIGA
jgi:hypothetical protein